MTAAAFAAIVLIGIGNQILQDRASTATLTSLAIVAWACVVAWGEARRRAR
jgi:hypothetical protein